jgi:hypothetical protein
MGAAIVSPIALVVCMHIGVVVREAQTAFRRTRRDHTTGTYAFDLTTQNQSVFERSGIPSLSIGTRLQTMRCRISRNGRGENF